MNRFRHRTGKFKEYACCFSLAKHTTYTENGLMKFDVNGFLQNSLNPVNIKDDPQYYNEIGKEFEDLFNNHKLLRCSYCNAIDTKENLDANVVHDKILCKEGHTVSEAYDQASYSARILPKMNRGELYKIKENLIKEYEIIKLNPLLKDHAHTILWEWKLKRHVNKTQVPKWWRNEYRELTYR